MNEYDTLYVGNGFERLISLKHLSLEKYKKINAKIIFSYRQRMCDRKTRTSNMWYGFSIGER